MSRWMMAVTALMACVITSCTSDAQSNDLHLDTVPTTSTSLPATTTTSSPPTTVPDTTTTVEVTTTTEAPTTTEPPATVEPVHTDPPTKEAQVTADFELAKDAGLHCAFDPSTCDFAEVAVAGSPKDLEVRHTAAVRIGANERAVQGHGDLLLRVESVGFEGDSAFVTICAYDTIVIYDIQDPLNPDDDIVTNDEKNSSRVRWEMRKPSDRWLMYEGTGIDELKGGDLCGF